MIGTYKSIRASISYCNKMYNVLKYKITKVVYIKIKKVEDDMGSQTLYMIREVLVMSMKLEETSVPWEL